MVQVYSSVQSNQVLLPIKRSVWTKSQQRLYDPYTIVVLGLEAATVIDGLLTALRIQFNHPSKYQLKRLVSRYVFVLDLDGAISTTTSACHNCMLLKEIPTHLQPQSISNPSPPPPDTVGSIAVAARTFSYCVKPFQATPCLCLSTVSKSLPSWQSCYT